MITVARGTPSLPGSAIFQDRLHRQATINATNAGSTIDDYLRKRGDFDFANYEECLSSGKGDAEVRADIDSAGAAGIRAVPTTFINGEKYEGVLSPDNLRDLAEKASGDAPESGSRR